MRNLRSPGPFSFPHPQATLSCENIATLTLLRCRFQPCFLGHCLRRYRALDRKDIQRIEHLLRKGRRQLDLFKSSEVTGVKLQAGAAPSSTSSSQAAAAASGPGS